MACEEDHPLTLGKELDLFKLDQREYLFEQKSRRTVASRGYPGTHQKAVIPTTTVKRPSMMKMAAPAVSFTCQWGSETA